MRQVVIQGEYQCTSCHAGENAASDAAMNLTGYNAAVTSAAFKQACAAALAKINFSDLVISPFLTAPEPESGDPSHPWKLFIGDVKAFDNAVLTWAQAEANAR